jgi:hypothetical protein
MRRFTRKGKKVYGKDKEGSDIYKDKFGFYVAAWNRRTMRGYKKYLKHWKPKTCKASRPTKTRKNKTKKHQ